MAAVSESLRGLAREAMLRVGGRGFMRFAQAGDALLVTDAPRRCADDDARRALADALGDAGFLCREDDGLLYLMPGDGLLDALCAALGEKDGAPEIDWNEPLYPAQAWAARLLRVPPEPLDDAGRGLVVDVLRLLWQDERHVLAGLGGVRARAAEMLRQGRRSGMHAAGRMLAAWLQGRQMG